jgi:choline dehydrogenase
MATSDTFEYVVVGSGAVGGTVAARLAERGRKVLVLEAGGDPKKMKGGDAAYPDDKERLPDDYDVPVFHAASTENEAIKWDYWVHHFDDPAERRQDQKFRWQWPERNGPVVDGVWYPRAGCLGGCTAHNAMICVYPHNADWDNIAYLTNDRSWRAHHMRKIFERLEHCHHRALLYRWLAKIGINPTRHGWDGWLSTEISIPREAVLSRQLKRVLLLSVAADIDSIGSRIKGLFTRLRWFLLGQGDPNDWRLVKDDAEGIRYPPLTTRNHARMGTRERLLQTQAKYPDNLTIELDALVTRVLFDGENRAVGVEYLKGAGLYQAHAEPSRSQGERREVRVTQEVILAGGAFNTPQLLMLSGIGPRQALDDLKIPVRVELPGVGTNLQDRYEVGVVYRAKEDWSVLKGSKYAKGDPQHDEWTKSTEGVYGTNGAVLAVIKRSFPHRPLPDLFCFALLGEFTGYYPNYSVEIVTKHNYMTWAVLKAHTNNRAGVVTLASTDPRERPKISFRYFQNDTGNQDLDSVVEGVKFVRELARPLVNSGLLAAETAPGPQVQTDDDLRKFVRYQCWGHHASCTCPIGSHSDPMAVLDGDFNVRGTKGLRVVDASVFPRIPGFFIVSAVYMIGEKAADVILASYKQNAAKRPGGAGGPGPGLKA